MSNVNALSATPTDFSSSDRLEHAGFLAVIGVAAALQFSIAIAQSLLAIAIVCWIALVLVRHERIEVPRFFWPLLALCRPHSAVGVFLAPAARQPGRLEATACSS